MRTTGEVTWTEDIGFHAWSSPVIVGDELLVATCTGELRAYSLADPRLPNSTWTLKVSESCIESTPAVWKGRIYVGVRDGSSTRSAKRSGRPTDRFRPRRARSRPWRRLRR